MNQTVKFNYKKISLKESEKVSPLLSFVITWHVPAQITLRWFINWHSFAPSFQKLHKLKKYSDLFLFHSFSFFPVPSHNDTGALPSPDEHLLVFLLLNGLYWWCQQELIFHRTLGTNHHEHVQSAVLIAILLVPTVAKDLDQELLLPEINLTIELKSILNSNKAAGSWFKIFICSIIFFHLKPICN